MIYEIFSTMPTFKPVSFQRGINILIADKSDNATNRQTRNGAGKSSLVEIVHFLLGSTPDRQTLFRNSVIGPHRFGMTFDLQGTATTVERSGAESKVFVRAGAFDTWPVRPRYDPRLDDFVVTNNQWKTILGNLMFGLPAVETSNPEDDEQGARFRPSFRSMISYLVRRQSAGAFLQPIRQSTQQKTFDQQVNLSYLVGLDWTISQRWEEVRAKEKTLKELKRASAEGVFGDLVGNAATLRTRLAVATQRLQALQENVSKFQVLPEYRALEAEASDLVFQINSLADANTIDRGTVTDLEQALQTEVEPDASDLERLYAEIGIALPDTVIRRYEEVRSFHQSIVENRRSYLGGEIQAAQQHIADRNGKIAELDARRHQIMYTLQSHGALDQLTKLQAELARRQAEAERLRLAFDTAQQLEGTITQLNIDRNQLSLRLQQDFREQSETLTKAIVTFENMSSKLYQDAGSLTIDPSTNGPVFDVTIPSQRSAGINKMQIFCFDMMLMQLCSERGFGPGFLIHDSHLFDGVDERQKALALQIGAQMAEELGFQYIVTMNSDALPPDSLLSPNFRLQDYILPLRLTDATEDGGLFGVRFG